MNQAPRLEGDVHPDPEVVFATGEVNFVAGRFANLYGTEQIHELLHGQELNCQASRSSLKGSPKTVPSKLSGLMALRVFLGVQWHAEYDPQTNPINRVLFERFGEVSGQGASAIAPCSGDIRLTQAPQFDFRSKYGEIYEDT